MNALFVAWRPAAPHEGWRPVGRLEHENGIYRFFYTQGAKKPGFRPFAKMERLDQVYESEELFPVFANRLLSQSRPEYEAYLRWGGFDITNPPDPIVILGVTEGLRQTDAVEVFPCPQPDADSCYFNKFFLHGIRWLPKFALARIGQLQQGDRLLLMLDLQNEYDPNAVAVRTDADRMLIGYFPRYLAHDVRQLVNRCDVDFIELFVERVNSDAPLQNRVLCGMRACWPDDFVPCTGEDFESIPEQSSARCVGR
ncbi:MAG: HIRAN domain-containing protein [Planctomycetaceae bacterium]|nr:HIRAN domain-containing protein [Planctomycetaceae bacterium]